MRRGYFATAISLLTIGALFVAAGISGAAPSAPSAAFERHQFTVSVSWSEETVWEYKYALRFGNGCDGNPAIERRRTQEGNGRESWRITARRPGLLNVNFSRHPYYRGRPQVWWATRHTVDLVRERSGTLETVAWCGSTAFSMSKASEAQCGRVAFPSMMVVDKEPFRRNALLTELWTIGNRSWRREKTTVRNCPNPPNYFGGVYSPSGAEPRDVAGMYGAPSAFVIPFRWDALKNKARKRFVIPLTYSGSFAYPAANAPSDPRETVTQTGKVTTVARGKLILTRKP
jgi:hypothetical protein